MSSEPDPVAGELRALIEKYANAPLGLLMDDEVQRRFRIQSDRGIKIRLSLEPDKYVVESPVIDCVSRLHLCRARCCSLDVVLSPQDLAERKLPVIAGQPYLLSRDPITKKCACMDNKGACTAYDYRPATCRSYDCREDARVWIDFEARIPAPLSENLKPLENAFAALSPGDDENV